MAQGKVYSSAVEALEDVSDGAVIMLGGFGKPGLPQSLVKALMELGPRDLTFICNTCFEPKPDEYDLARLVERGQVRKVITTFFGRPNQEIPALGVVARRESWKWRLCRRGFWQSECGRQARDWAASTSPTT